MSADEHEIQMPRFVGETQKWQEGEGAGEEIEALKRLTATHDLRLERYATSQALALQSTLRPRLRAIPGFWPFALSNVPAFSALACLSKDLDALSSLNDVELVVDARDPRAYSLVFRFGPNDYFSDDELVRRYVLREGDKKGKKAEELLEDGRKKGEGKAEEGEVTDEQLEFNHQDDLVALPTTIHWKSDATNLCKLLPRDGDDAEDEDGPPSGSFFHWFADEDDELMQDLGWDLREEGVPRCIDCYLGLNSNEFDDESDDDEDDFDEDEEDGDDAEEIDLEEEEQKPPAKKAKRS